MARTEERVRQEAENSLEKFIQASSYSQMPEFPYQFQRWENQPHERS